MKQLSIQEIYENLIQAAKSIRSANDDIFDFISLHNKFSEKM